MFLIMYPTSCIQTLLERIIQQNAIWIRSSCLDFVWKKSSPSPEGWSQEVRGWDSDPVVLLYFTCACKLFAKRKKKLVRNRKKNDMLTWPPPSYLKNRCWWHSQRSVRASCLCSVPVVSKPFHIHYWGKFITWNVNFFFFF